MKQYQYKAGFVLESLLLFAKKSNETLLFDGLLNSLSCFDVISNLSQQDFSSHLAVLHNILVRGLPTIPTLHIEEKIAEAFPEWLEKSNKQGSVGYKLKPAIDNQLLVEALHIVDSRLEVKKLVYPISKLESGFEIAILFKYLPKEWNFLIQLLAPQRQLSDLLSNKEKGNFIRQEVDFAVEIPYKYEEEIDFGRTKKNLCYSKGFVIEADGVAFHGWNQIGLDAKRDSVLSQNKWTSIRIKSDEVLTGIETLTKKLLSDEYIQIIRKNSRKIIEKEWKEALQVALTPIAIARLQRVFLEILQNNQKKELKIAILERDVPCGFLALEDFKELYENLSIINSTDVPSFPPIKLEVYSNQEFIDSPLHQLPLNESIDFIDDGSYDFIIDIAILQRSGLNKRELVNEDHWIIIRSAHYDDKYTPRKFKTGELLTYKPIVSKDKHTFNQPIPVIEATLEYFIQYFFRKRHFRQGQLPILHRALQNKTVIGLLPTGGGKSLTYQLAALLQPGITLVIDPIKSLMQDQYDNLRKIGIDGCNFINSSLDTMQRKFAIEHFKKGAVLFSFISPERLQIQEFRLAIRAMYTDKIYFSYCVIDEVHCVSEWGHDFRPAYLRLGINAITYCKTASGNPVALFGLTATASYDVLADVERELSSSTQALDSDATVRYENTTRNELQYNIIPIEVAYETFQITGLPPSFQRTIKGRNVRKIVGESKQGDLIKLLNCIGKNLKDYNQEDRLEEILKHAYANLLSFETQGLVSEEKYISENIASLKLPFEETTFFNEHHNNAGIIFCPHKKKTSSLGVESFTNKLNLEMPEIKHGWFMGSAGFLGDKMVEVEKKAMQYQQDFVNNQLDVMIATKAFGMGIDKSNIRFTCHANFPNSIESFVQEGGRAGRDKQLAIVNVLYNSDKFIAIDKLSAASVERLNLPKKTKKELKKISNRLFEFEEFNATTLPKLSQKSTVYERIIKEKYRIENVDKDVLLFFHGTSFKGARKEWTILEELLQELKFPVKPNLHAIADELKALYGIDKVRLSLWSKGRLSRLYININGSTKAIGYLNVKNNFSISAFDFIDKKKAYTILQYAKNRILERTDRTLFTNLTKQKSAVPKNGILPLLELSEVKEVRTLRISDTNVFADNSFYAQKITEFINQKIAVNVTLKWVTNNLLKYISSFDTFLDKIAHHPKISHDFYDALSPEDKSRLEKLYYSPRYGEDTAKAIYRLFCLGVITDYTKDYNAKEYQVTLVRKLNGEYKKTLKNYLLRYNSERQVAKIVADIPTNTIGEEITVCLDKLLNFVYDQIARKRKMGIDSMQELCEEGLRYEDKFEANKRIKEFIFTYFNSKYAREFPPHEIEVEGVSIAYSLVLDTNQAKEASWEITFKYMKAMGMDKSGGFDDNIKHLRGATLRLLRSNPDNSSLLLLKGFTLLMLSTKRNNLAFREEAEQEIWNGLKSFIKNEEPFDLDIISNYLTQYKTILSQYTENTTVFTSIETLISAFILNLHNEWLTNNFKPNYLKQ